ncbi:MAG: ATP-binding protein [Verrucomicrobiales bacterium]|nr:ATP-binding protein [Verrucomicrobiales bacterium]
MFRTSTPVTAAAFHNRSREREELEHAIDQLLAGAPKWVAILGPRKIGKTSLVLEAMRRKAGPGLCIVNLDIQETMPVSTEVFRRLALRMVDAVFGPDLGESPERLARQPAAYRALLQRSQPFAALPPSVRTEILELGEGEATAERAGAWLQLPQQTAEALDLHLVVALDEFQELGALESARRGFDPFALLRSHWQKHSRVAYFVSGSARSLLLELLNKEHSPFFQHFSILEIGPFLRTDAIALLTRESPAERPIPSEIAEVAYDTLGGHPFYLQLLGETLGRLPRAPNSSDLKAALQDLVFSSTGRLGLYFENEHLSLVGRSTFLAATLNALADGPSSVTDVAKRIRAPSGATVGYLGRLQDAVRRRPDGLYELTDAVFGLWLRWRQPGGTVVPMSVVGNEAEQSVARALSAMGFDLVYQSRASRGSFDLLATRGAAQLGLQVKRSELPLRFSSAEWSRMKADAERLGWHWVLVAVDSKGSIKVLDPDRASIAREVRAGPEAVIDNLVLWLDRLDSRTSRPRKRPSTKP